VRYCIEEQGRRRTELQAQQGKAEHSAWTISAGHGGLAVVMNTSPVIRSVVIVNEHGLHARPAEMFARSALQFQSRIEVRRENEQVDAKSILDLLTLGATQGTKLVIEAHGIDAEQAVELLASLVESGFAEAYP
jgi:phosphotransferase system HPr (HPr) family protein